MGKHKLGVEDLNFQLRLIQKYHARSINVEMKETENLIKILKSK